MASGLDVGLGKLYSRLVWSLTFFSGSEVVYKGLPVRAHIKGPCNYPKSRGPCSRHTLPAYPGSLA